jgi:hypothetical protein
MHRGKIVRFALAMKAEGMPLPNPPVDGANDLPLLVRILSRQIGSAKNKKELSLLILINGGEGGIRTPGTLYNVHTLSRRAPSTSSDTSPSVLLKCRLIIQLPNS